jgi:hypothetical protein
MITQTGVGRVRHLLLGTAVILAGCAGHTSTGPVNESSTLSADVHAALIDGLQDEYRAAAVYEAVLAQLGQVLPFRNILLAEQQHAASIAALLAARGLALPAREQPGAIPQFASLSAACSLGATAEVENIAMYDRLLALDLPIDVQRVFEANRRASLINHLPAFERCGPIMVR